MFEKVSVSVALFICCYSERLPAFRHRGSWKRYWFSDHAVYIEFCTDNIYLFFVNYITELAGVFCFFLMKYYNEYRAHVNLIYPENKIPMSLLQVLSYN